MNFLLIFIITLAAFKSSVAEESSICTHDNLHYLPHAYDCTRYILCHHRVPVEKSCAPGLQFSNSAGKCMLPNEANCQMKCPEVDEPGVMVFMANMDDCQRFFACYDGIPNPKICADGFLWDDRNNWCYFKDQVDCGQRKNLSKKEQPSIDGLIDILKKILDEKYWKNITENVKKIK